MNARITNDLANLIPVGAHIEVVVTTASKALYAAADIPAGAKYARIQARGADLTYTMDAATTTPVATGPGFILANGNEITVRIDVGLMIRGIRNASTDVDVQVQFMG